jgi:gamma-glutamyl hydrolase
VQVELAEGVLTKVPVIGIMTANRVYEPFTSYIMGAYVRFIEQAGSKVVPILQTDSDEDTAALLGKINGVVFPGGSGLVTDEEGKLTLYGRKFKYILDKAKEMNSNGIHFPILGICLGLQAIPVVETLDASTLVIGTFESMDTSDAVTFKVDPRETRSFSTLPDDILVAIENENITYNSHRDGVLPSVFEDHKELHDYHVVATTFDKN